MQNYVVNCLIGFLAVMAICQTTFGRTTSLLDTLEELNENDENGIGYPTTRPPRNLVKNKKSKRVGRAYVTVSLVDVVDERIRLEEGQSYLLECTVMLNSTAAVYSYGEKELTSQMSLPSTSSGVDDYHLIFAKEKYLIDCASKKDEGEIKCVAITAEGIAEKTAIITVEESSRAPSCPTDLAPVITSRTKTIFSPIGSTITIKCRAQGYPRPEINWFNPKGNKIFNDPSGRYVILEDGDLLIENLDWDEDMGPFTCIASSSQGRDKAETFIYPNLRNDRSKLSSRSNVD